MDIVSTLTFSTIEAFNKLSIPKTGSFLLRLPDAEPDEPGSGKPWRRLRSPLLTGVGTPAEVEG
jgi:hypothetical protein